MARELVESDGDGAFDDVAVLVDEGQVIGSGSFGADGLGDGEHPVAVADDGRQDVAHGSGLFGLDVEVVGFPAASQPDIHELPGDRQVGEDVGGAAPNAEGGVPHGFQARGHGTRRRKDLPNSWAAVWYRWAILPTAALAAHGDR